MRPPPLTPLLLLAAQTAASQQPPSSPTLPIAIRKMPPDHGAKFHHDYCAFADHPDHHTAAAAAAAAAAKPLAPALLARSAAAADDARRLGLNASAELLPRAAFAVLLGSETSSNNKNNNINERGMNLRGFSKR
ncbi:hypothetical protein C8A05DRAFT_38937, partial [Staphylotrichum tortipilum]